MSVVRCTTSKLTRTTFNMATIRARKLADGSVSYTAQIRIKRDGVQVYQESQTFARKQAAQAWARKRGAELDEPGAIERANRTGVTVKDMITRYLVCCSRINISSILATLPASSNVRRSAGEYAQNRPQPRRTRRAEPARTFSHHQPARRSSGTGDSVGSPRLHASRNCPADRVLTPRYHLLVSALSSSAAGQFAR